MSERNIDWNIWHEAFYEVLMGFNFQLASDLMTKVNGVYGGNDFETTPDELKKLARKLLLFCIEMTNGNETATSADGCLRCSAGFVAGRPRCTIEFVPFTRCATGTSEEDE